MCTDCEEDVKRNSGNAATKRATKISIEPKLSCTYI